MISNNNNVETSRMTLWAKEIMPRLTVNRNYIFLLVSIVGLDPIYPAFLVVLLMILPGLIFHNTLRFRFQRLINSNREDIEAISKEANCSTVWYTVSHPWDAFKLCLLGTIVNIATAVIICLGPYYLTPFSVSPLTYFNLAMALLHDIAMLYLGDYQTYRYLDSIHKQLVSIPVQTQLVTIPEENIDYTSLAQIHAGKTSDEPSISGFIKTDTISEEDLAIDIIDTTER